MRYQVVMAVAAGFGALGLAMVVPHPAITAMAKGMQTGARRPIDSADKCLPASTAGYDIVMLGQYGGSGISVPFQIKGAQHGTRVTTVSGDPGRPIVLVLSAYESTVWDVSRVPAGRIKGIVASGYYAQGVTGTAGDVPVAMTHQSADNGRDPDVDPSACPDLRFAYGGMKMQYAASGIKQALGRYPSEFFGGYATSAFDLSGDTPSVYTDEPDTRNLITERPIVTDGPRSGHEGLKQMVAAGVLKIVSQTDIHNWAQRGASFKPLNMTANMMMNGYGARNGEPSVSMGGYLITRDVKKLPGGLDGGLKVTFLVPQGISAPVDMQTHSEFFKIEGIKGVPVATGVGAPRDFYLDDMRRSFNSSRTTNHHAIWTKTGALVKETGAPPMRSVDSSVDEGPIGALTGVSNSQAEYDSMRYRTMDQYRARVLAMRGNPGIIPPTYMPPAPVETATPKVMETVQEPSASRDMTPTALVTALLLAFGMTGLFMTRRGGGPIREENTSDAYTAFEQKPEHVLMHIHPTDVHHDESQDDVERLKTVLQKVVEASQQDETALSVLRFRRTVTKAMNAGDYDEDLVDELITIVNKHVPETAAVFLRTAGRSTTTQVQAIEESLRTAINLMGEKIEQIVEMQSARDAERMRQSTEFIGKRHPHAGGAEDVI